ncbi:MAG: MopE-related protein [Polyangiales bacterium]
MAAETCNNVDDDCDGATDESLARDCYGGPSGTRDVGVCRGGTQTCAAGAWGACAGEVRPAATETCGDGDDDTCDGMVDEGCVSRPNFALGNVSACWLDEGDRAYCWGGNFYGMTVYSTTSGSGTAVRTPELDGLTVAAGEYFNCALRAGGTVWCAGLNTEGQLGDNSTTNRMSPVQAQGVTAATAIAGGYKHACAVVAGGAVRCWGMNGRSQLGAATSTTCGAQACSRTAVAVPGVTGATQLALGYAHSCALRSDGTVWCWGDNTYGQMGRGAMGTAVVSPGAVPGLAGVRAIEGGYNHTCALMGDGTVRCWGQNSYGQLGDGTMDTRTSPVQVQGLRGVEQIAVGFYHGCARAAGGLSCWGYNTYGQVGNGTTTNSLTPSTVPLTGITDVGTGYWHTCARSTGTTLWCWGWNLANMLGTGNTTPSQSASPLRVVF